MSDEVQKGRPATRREAAVAFLLKNPSAKDTEVSQSLGVDKATVGRARTKLINEGLIPAETRRRQPAATRAGGPAKKAAPLDSLLSDEDLRALDSDNADDGETRKRILGALRKIAFAPGMNYETAMSAMSLWVKLKDQAATKELGPGAPLTYADAKERLLTLMRAVGFELVYECFQELFVPKEAPSEGHVSAEHNQTPPGPAGATPAP